MKSFRFGSFAGIAAITMVLLLGAPALAETGEEDIPLPLDNNKPAMEAPLSEPTAQEAAPEAETMPAPSLGEESLPQPKEDKAAEKSRNVVNKAPDEEEVFLPTPAVNDNVNNAPIGMASPSGSTSASDLDYRTANQNRPMFMFHGGFVARNYPSTLVTQVASGVRGGASIRLFNVAQAVFFHAVATFDFLNVGQVGPYSAVRDVTSHYGGMLEIGLGRRLSLYGSLLRRHNVLSSQIHDNPNVWLLNIGEKPTWMLGAGLQYDFYVVPHGSLGVLAHVERDMGSLVLTMALEPAPRKKQQLNFDEL